MCKDFDVKNPSSEQGTDEKDIYEECPWNSHFKFLSTANVKTNMLWSKYWQKNNIQVYTTDENEHFVGLLLDWASVHGTLYTVGINEY